MFVPMPKRAQLIRERYHSARRSSLGGISAPDDRFESWRLVMAGHDDLGGFPSCERLLLCFSAVALLAAALTFVDTGSSVRRSAAGLRHGQLLDHRERGPFIPT